MFPLDQDQPKGPPEISIPEVDRAIQAGILGGQRIFSAAGAIAAKQGKIFHRAVYGQLGWEGTPRRTTFDSVFDLASLTKPFATGLALIQLVSKGRLTLDAPVSRLLKDFTGPVWDKIVLDNLLDHTSGLAAHKPFWETLKREQDANPSATLLGGRAGEARVRELLIGTPPQNPPNELSVYSDLNFIVLGWVVEQVVGKRLDLYVQQELYKPLGLTNLFFVDLTDPKRPHARRQFVATEKCKWRRKLLCGEVHDQNCWAMGGVAGHAGLFGTLDDAYKLAQMFFDSYAGKPDAPFHSGTVRRFFTRSKRTCNKTWALGWDTPSPKDSLAGSRMSRNAVGHLGYTGVSVWLDLQHEVVTLNFTNRAHLSPEGKDDFMRKYRPHVEDLFAAYAQSWTPPVEDEEVDEYAAAKKLQQRKKLAGGPAQGPPAAVPPKGMIKKHRPPPS